MGAGAGADGRGQAGGGSQRRMAVARVCAHVPRRHTRHAAPSSAAAGDEHRAPHAPACDASGSMRLPLLPLFVLPLVLVRPAAGENTITFFVFFFYSVF